MSELEKLGITVQRSFRANSDEETAAVGDSESTELAFTLPNPSPVQVTFSKEGLGKKLAKIFKKEIQTGDAAFDKAVFVATDTPQETRALLESEVVRGAIARIVNSGGSAEIDEGFVKLELAGHQENEDADTVALVRALLAVSSRTTL